MKFYIRECSFVRCFSNSVLFGILCILCKSTKIAFHLYFLWTAEDQLLSILSSTIDVSMIIFLIIISASKNVLGYKFTVITLRLIDNYLIYGNDYLADF